MSTKHNEIHRENGDKSQAKAFRKAARELGADNNEDQFKETLRTVAKAKPQPQPKKHDR